MLHLLMKDEVPHLLVSRYYAYFYQTGANTVVSFIAYFFNDTKISRSIANIVQYATCIIACQSSVVAFTDLITIPNLLITLATK